MDINRNPPRIPCASAIRSSRLGSPSSRRTARKALPLRQPARGSHVSPLWPSVKHPQRTRARPPRCAAEAAACAGRAHDICMCVWCAGAAGGGRRPEPGGSGRSSCAWMPMPMDGYGHKDWRSMCNHFDLSCPRKAIAEDDSGLDGLPLCMWTTLLCFPARTEGNRRLSIRYQGSFVVLSWPCTHGT